MTEIEIVQGFGLAREEQAIVNHEWEKADRALYGEDYDKFNWERQVIYFKATHHGEFAGILRLEIEGGLAYIDELLVFESYRNKGIGTQLLLDAENFARENKCHKMSLETDENIAAMDLYVRQGFTEEARLKHQEGDRDTLVMGKILHKY